MAHDDRTEKPTPKRRKEARKKGQVARSTDLSGAGVLVAALLAVGAFAPTMVGAMAGSMRDILTEIRRPAAVSSAAGLSGLFHEVMNTVLTTVGPIAAICVGVGVLLNVAQVGFRPSLIALKPDVKRINPMAGFKNIFGARIAFELGKALAKVTVVGAVAAMALIPELTNLGASVGTTPGALGSLMGSGALGIAQRAALAYLLIGVIDFVWQRRRHDKQLKMTRQEVRDEAKQYSLAPEVRAAIRRRQMHGARARMMAAVPTADVVVTNPTHFAVALSYDGTNPAPVVAQRPDRARPAARPAAAQVGRDRPDDPGGAVRGGRPSARLRLPDGG